MSRLEEIELMIKELQALLQYEEVLKSKQYSKSKVSGERLAKTEEWQEVTQKYYETRKEISERISELRRLLMKQMEVFDEYYKKNPFWITPYPLDFDWVFPEPKVKAYIPMYEPLEVVKCKKWKDL